MPRRLRRKTRNRRKQRGGRVIGSGMQGIAFSPPLECETGPPNVIKNTGRASPFTKTRKSYVSKIAKANIAKTELDAGEILRETVDPYGLFTAPAMATCQAAPANRQTNANYASVADEISEKGYDTLIFSRYRGTSLQDIFEQADTLSKEQVENILVALANLVEQVAEKVNKKAGLLHYDAHAGNIVYDFATREATLIDFGFARPLDAETVAALKSGDLHVPATYDVKKIHDDVILQFFMFGSDPPTSYLLSNPYLKDWFQQAKTLRKHINSTQEEYLDSVKELKRFILITDIHEASSNSNAGL